MNIYFCGIGGVALGPLAQIASDAGFSVAGSDREKSLMTEKLVERTVPISYQQDGGLLRERHAETPIDWFVYTSALPDDHPELCAARELGIKTSKRDELLQYIIEKKDLKLIAVTGTHGKTGTSSMLVWIFKQLGIPVSYSVGSTLSWAESGAYDPDSEYFIYECDEFDRNFLHFSPAIALITTLAYDHPDTYPTKTSYFDAFSQFAAQSNHTITWRSVIDAGMKEPIGASWILSKDEQMDLPVSGVHTRNNATLLIKACEFLNLSTKKVREALACYPGAQRRFEKLGDNLYSDYAHHPNEIAATIQMALEHNPHIAVVYQPHQNVRQHSIRHLYTTCMDNASAIYWLPTYLSREDEALPLLSREDLAKDITNKDALYFANMDDALWGVIQMHRTQGHLVLCLGAGDIDRWVRSHLS